MTEQTPLTQDQVRFALVREAGWTEAEADEALAEIEAAAARRAIEGSGVVEALRRIAVREPAPALPGCTCDPDSATDDDGNLVMCDLHEPMLRHLRWETLALLVIDYQAFMRHALAVADAALAALPRPEEPRVERCAVCGVGRWVTAHDPEAGPSCHPFTPEAR